MGILSTIREHATMASGNFATMFKNVAIPPLPAAVSCLLAEMNRPEPNIEKLEMIIASEPEISARVLKTINSPLYALPTEVVSIRHAIALMGIKRIRSLVISYATLTALPKPKGELFHHSGYWTDALLRSLLARSLTCRQGGNDPDVAFTGMLLADVAIPVLLCSWRKYYEPVVQRWCREDGRLSELERNDFGWDHSQAAAWILQYWGFPEQLVCFAGVHNTKPDELRRLDLQDSVAIPISLASLLPSVLKPELVRCRRLIDEAAEHLGMSPDDWQVTLGEVRSNFASICRQFGLPDDGSPESLDQLESCLINTEA